MVEPSKIIFCILKYYAQKEDITWVYTGGFCIPKYILLRRYSSSVQNNLRVDFVNSTATALPCKFQRQVFPPYEPLSKFLVSPLIAPIVVPTV